MREFKIGQAAELLGVSVDVMRRWADGETMPSRRTDGGQRMIDGGALAELAVKLATTPDPGIVSLQSARNRMTGLVTRVLRDKVVSQVEIQAGPHRIVSLMTTEAVDELGLRPGVLAVAAVKSTNVVIEIPDGLR